MEEAARKVYRYVKLLNYLLSASKLRKAQRNSVAVVRLVLGQCMRRLISAEYVRTTDDSRRLSQRHSLIPYLYELECSIWKPGDDGLGFQRVSATVLSFYVQECAGVIQPAVIKALLGDLSLRKLSFLPHHYSMLILYLGKVRNMGEAMRVFEHAMEDPVAQKTEAIYYYALRAFSSAFLPQAKRKARAGEMGLVEGNAAENMAAIEEKSAAIPNEVLGDDELDYMGGADGYSVRGDKAAAAEEDGDMVDDGFGLELEQKHSAEHVQAAKICTSIFQIMIDRNIDVSYRTYRELIYCMVQFQMFDKARQIFKFAIENLDGSKIAPHFVEFYLRKTTRTPHEKHTSLRRHLLEMPELLAVFRRYSAQTLASYFGIFQGDLQGFLDQKKRLPVEGRAGRFLQEYLRTMGKAKRVARFVDCLLSGNDKLGQFKGYNFPKLGSDGSGLEAVEREIAAACQWMETSGCLWLRNKAVIYSLLPVLPWMAAPAGDVPGMDFIRELIVECKTTAGFMAKLDSAGVEGCDISMVNQFLRVRYLGLTFQRYAREKAKRHSDASAWERMYGERHCGSGSTRNDGLFWPSFMYTQSNGAMAQYAPLATTTDKDGYSHDAARAVPEAVESWKHLRALWEKGVCDGLATNTSTVSIFSLISIQSGSWQFGSRIWSDVLSVLEGHEAGTGAQGLTGAPLKGVGVYKQYLYYLTMASLAATSKSAAANSQQQLLQAQEKPAESGVPSKPHLFCDAAITNMLGLMSKNGVQVTSGLLCQGIRAAFEIGRIDIADALEQWQLYRERRGLAPAGYLRQYFHALTLPEIRFAQTPVLGSGCPRLKQHISEQMSGR
ncbi:hypothetical protein GGI12_002254 [Dipsacomyces acuminosporus]|nr:hypothetical protein GGI12_002254 [Dipsacomyces acuminosporus]